MGMGNIAITGMQASMSDMEVISNNISNANTAGFKKSTANFSDLFPSQNDAGGTQIGMGVSLTSMEQDFSSGGPSQGSATDLMINNNGFFILADPASGQVSYSRAGHTSFTNGFITIGNQRLQGFPAVNGAIPSGVSPTDIQISTAPLPAKATTTVTQQHLNLSATDSIPADSTFSPTDINSFNSSTTTTFYDSLGNSNQLSLYYIKTSANNWTTVAQINGSTVGTGSLVFSDAGALTTTTGLGALPYTPTDGAAPQTLIANMTGATQSGNPDGSSPFTQDGYPAGSYQNYTVDQSGNVYAQYSNQQQQLCGQIALANFISPEGLQNIGNASWVATTSSGTPIINQSASTKNVSSGELEMSNVDLATEMVNLINAQNDFQANAQVEQTYNQIMQTVTKL